MDLDDTDYTDDDFDDEYLPQDEDDEEMHYVRCSQCGAEVWEESPSCPECGHYLEADTNPWTDKPLWWKVVGLVGIAAIVISLLSWLG